MTKKFTILINVILFIVIFSILNITLNDFYKNVVMQKSHLKASHQELFNQYAQTKILVMGDSHAQMGINTNYTPNIYNYASGGETYIQTYYKLKNILSSNSIVPSQIILPVDFHSFTSNKNKIDNPFYWSSIVNYDEIGQCTGKIAKYKVESFIGKYFSYLWQGRHVRGFLLNRESITFKGFLPSTAIYNATLNNNGTSERIKAHFENTILWDECISYYFKKIISLATENNIQITLVQFPITKEYYNHAKKLGVVDIVNENLNKILPLLKDIKFVDYHNLYFDKPMFFSDPDHLNTLGSKDFTSLLFTQLFNSPPLTELIVQP